MDIYKKMNIGMIIGFIVAGLASFWYLNQICTPAMCYNGAYAVALQTISLTLIIHGIIFLMLPREYFMMWVKTILTWFVPLTIYVAYNPRSASLLFHANIMDAMQLMMILLSFVSIVFVAVRFTWI